MMTRLVDKMHTIIYSVGGRQLSWWQFASQSETNRKNPSV